MQQQGAGEHVCNQPGFLDSSHKPFFRSTTQQTHNPYWRRIEANIGCEELFSEQHRSATHQRNASKAEKDGLHLTGVRLLISRSFYPRRKEFTVVQRS